ncbi:MAG: hypothetical protein FJW36_09555 [Acidobacteria bacterium]|nr:hypothetical protein [Acidobacteriota bacterium]
MDIGNVILLAVMAALLAILYLGSSVMAIRHQKPQLKTTGTMLCLGGAAVWVMVLFAALSNGVAPPFRERIAGAEKSGKPVIREVQYEVLNREISHLVEVRLANYADHPPEGMLMVRYKVYDATGAMIVDGDDSVGVKNGLLWNPARFGFHPVRSGMHKILIEVPAGVAAAEILIEESRD